MGELTLCKILVSTDGSEYSSGAERIALYLSKKCGVKTFYVCHVIYYNPEHFTMVPRDTETMLSKARAILDRLKEQASKEGISVEGLFPMSESIEAGIAESAEKIQADLIVMGRRGIRGLAKHFIGSATLGVIPKVKCPVLICPRTSEIRGQGILCAVDGSEVSLKALEFATKFSKKLELTLYLLSVITDKFGEDKAKKVLDEAKKFTLKEGVSSESLLYRGSPSQLILEIAKQKDLDFIVMGNRGLKGMQKIIFGSVAEDVVSKTDRPVLIVK
ncbi:universal stress protein [Caldimicrobium thiodismutans]|jgi:nucleotide-binding universal stress UspA family protein|uniref:Universal stress protein n=1 Tax=Caldimicrobium thiodismutans TaxID=1653476 RepID=A0A0U4W2K0_9BACT|nr:universal stress protein [Caldimicrobium thiodismutans]BAU23307.1 universal stress protein [Caldimicrobium thiodismutans]